MAKKTEVRPATGHINPFGLRMQPDLREQLESAASESGRSLNAEIVARLEASFSRRRDDEPGSALLGDLLFRKLAAEEQAALDSIDWNSTEGLVHWLELVDEYSEKHYMLRDMVDEAVEIYEQRLADKESEATKPKPKKSKP